MQISRQTLGTYLKLYGMGMIFTSIRYHTQIKFIKNEKINDSSHSGLI